MLEFLQMGGYAAYVWPSFALTVAVMVGLAWQAHRRHAQLKRRLRRRLEQQA